MTSKATKAKSKGATATAGAGDSAKASAGTGASDKHRHLVSDRLQRSVEQAEQQRIKREQRQAQVAERLQREQEEKAAEAKKLADRLSLETKERELRKKQFDAQLQLLDIQQSLVEEHLVALGSVLINAKKSEAPEVKRMKERRPIDADVFLKTKEELELAVIEITDRKTMLRALFDACCVLWLFKRGGEGELVHGVATTSLKLEGKAPRAPGSIGKDQATLAGTFIVRRLCGMWLVDPKTGRRTSQRLEIEALGEDDRVVLDTIDHPADEVFLPGKIMSRLTTSYKGPATPLVAATEFLNWLAQAPLEEPEESHEPTKPTSKPKPKKGSQSASANANPFAALGDGDEADEDQAEAAQQDQTEQDETDQQDDQIETDEDKEQAGDAEASE